MSLRRSIAMRALAMPAVRPFALDKDLRLGTHAAVCVLGAFATALFAPVISLVVAPLLLGIPHLASEARVFLRTLRPSRALLATVLVIALALVAIGALSVMHPDSPLVARLECATALTGAAIVVGRFGRGPAPRLLAFTAVALAFACAVSPNIALVTRTLAIALHGFVALAFWAGCFRLRRLYAAPAIALTVAGFTALLVVRSPVVAAAFATSVHYALWLVIIPQEISAAKGPPTWRMTARVWLRDLGRVATVLVLAAGVVLLVASARYGSTEARDAYLAGARFHIWVELPLAALVRFGTELRS